MKIQTPEEKQIKQKIDQLIAEKKAALDRAINKWTRICEYANSLMTTCNFHPTCKFVLVVFEGTEFVMEFSGNQHKVIDIAHADYLKALNDAPETVEKPKKRRTTKQ